MGRGGTDLLWSSGLTCTDVAFALACCAWRRPESGRSSFIWCIALLNSHWLDCQCYRDKPYGQLVLVSLMHYCTSTPSLSTSWSRTTLQGAQGSGKSHLKASFPLRCFQRLSLPNVATRQCHWRDNRNTNHRRCIVSLLSSEWDQVVPTLYGRQAIRLLPRGLAAAANWVCDRIGIACSCRFSVCLSTYRLTAKLFGCYMVKPHGQLVLVSSTPHSAYTPNLSTS